MPGSVLAVGARWPRRRLGPLYPAAHQRADPGRPQRDRGRAQAGQRAVLRQTVEAARAAYAAAREAEPSPFWWAVFDLGFVLLWHGDLDEATVVLRESLAEAERRGDVTTRSRALTYLMVAGRKRGDVQGVRRAIGPVIEGAREASLPEYEAMAIANRAWAAWRSGDETAAADAQAALRMWEGLPVRYFLDWMALWPLVAIALASQHIEQAAEYARGMLPPRSSYSRNQPRPWPRTPYTHGTQASPPKPKNCSAARCAQQETWGTCKTRPGPADNSSGRSARTIAR